MNLQLLRGHPDARLSAAIERFEQEFTYPLGAHRRFRIAHGGDCWRFFAALGDAAYVVVDDVGLVVGVLGAARRRVVLPDGGDTTALYLGDLKIASAARGGLVLIGMLRAIRKWADQTTPVAFAVVMDGTALTPSGYTGRAGVPAFQLLGSIAILWLHTAGDELPESSTVRSADDAQGAAVFAALSFGSYYLPDGDPAHRSLLAPRWWVAEQHACGRLEDTLRAKRLSTTDGEEMRSAHLSCFAYRTCAAGLAILTVALSRAAQAGYPMLFVAVPGTDVETWCLALGKRVRSVAPATVFGTGLAPHGRWVINTADI